MPTIYDSDFERSAPEKRGCRDQLRDFGSDIISVVVLLQLIHQLRDLHKRVFSNVSVLEHEVETDTYTDTDSNTESNHTSEG